MIFLNTVFSTPRNLILVFKEQYFWTEAAANLCASYALFLHISYPKYQVKLPEVALYCFFPHIWVKVEENLFDVILVTNIFEVNTQMTNNSGSFHLGSHFHN